MSDTNFGDLVISVPNLTDGRYEALDAYTIEPGKNYVVLVDGVSYEAVGKIYDDSRYGQVECIGNLALVGAGGDTGEPFIIYRLFMEGIGYYCCIITKPIANSIECYKKADTKSAPISYIKFLCGTEFPYLPKNIWGLQLAKRRTGETEKEPMVYGVEWDYSQSSTKLARTDGAVAFASPTPATDLTSVGTSPFDNVMPWSGMKRKTIGADEMVYIPEFYFRVEDDQINSKMKWQIASVPKDGFIKHPGSGRYVSRYHVSNNGGYVSQSGLTPISTGTQSLFRTNCASKGEKWWMLDIATWSAIQILYLVEYADFNIQTVLGSGQTSGTIKASGVTDSAMYHTLKRDGESNQYRWIENPYSNTRDAIDGMLINNYRVYIGTNNGAFSNAVSSLNDTGVDIPSTNGTISQFALVESAPWAFIPNKSRSGAGVSDSITTASGLMCLVAGGKPSTDASLGLFAFDVNQTPTESLTYVGARLIYIP